MPVRTYTFIASRHFRQIVPPCCAIALLVFAPHALAAPPITARYSIAQQDMGAALREFAVASGRDTIFASQLVAGKTASAVNGTLTAEEALRRLLTGTGLTYRRTPSGDFVVCKARAALPKGTDPNARPNERAGAALTANTARDPPYQPSATLGEIVVTAASRQPQQYLNAPAIETVLSGHFLNSLQTSDLTDVAHFVPGLSLSQSLGVSGTQISLRGVGTNAENPFIDSSVALNVDGLVITQGVAYSSAMFDVNRIEVLKGPQALFYGKNSPGGVVDLVTADPTHQFELITSYGYEFEAAEHRAQFIISGPVTQTLLLRLATQYDTLGGYFTNAATAAPGLGGLDPISSGEGGDSYVVRLTGIWEPSDEFKGRLKANVTNDLVTGGVGVEYVSCPAGTAPVAPENIPFITGDSCKVGRVADVVDLNPRDFADLLYDNGGLYNETKQDFGTWEMDYRPRPDITLTSVTGYYYLRFLSQQNATTSTFAGPAFASIDAPLRRRDVTEELRVNSDFSGPLNFSAGAFYQASSVFNQVVTPGNAAIYPHLIGDYQQLVGIHSTSAYGELRWRIIPKLELSGGARWTEEKRNLTVWNLISGAPSLFPTAVPNISENNVSPAAIIKYKPTSDVMAYASYKTGFKSGSFNFAEPSGVLPNYSFGEEHAHGWEAGVKAQMLDQRLFTDLLFYHYSYTGLQVGVASQAENGVIETETLNAGSSLVWGMDFDVDYLPAQVQGLTLKGSVEWNHSHFETLNDVPCWGGQTVSQGCNEEFNSVTGLYNGQNLSGTPLLFAPLWAVNFGFDYDIPLSNDLTLAFSNVNQFSSRYLTELSTGSSAFYQSAYVKANLSLSLQGKDDKWELSFIGNNISDVILKGSCLSDNARNGILFGGQVTGGTTEGPAGPDEVACYMQRGREVWVRATYRLF